MHFICVKATSSTFELLRDITMVLSQFNCNSQEVELFYTINSL